MKFVQDKAKRIIPYTEKWGVPTYMYNGKEAPAMMSGSGYILSHDAAICAYKESLKLPFFHLEDVHVNGFAGQNCGYNMQQITFIFHVESFNLQKCYI